MFGTSGPKPCNSIQQDLVPFLYGELPDHRGDAIEAHLRSCASCKEELASFRSTLDLVDSAGLVEMATHSEPGDWIGLRDRLLEARSPAAVSWTGHLLRAAAILVVVGSSFILGRNWDSVAPGQPPAIPDDASGPEDLPSRFQDGSWRLRVFSEQTNGYLDRTRLVLLELANTDGTPVPGMIRNASRSLLKENAHARQVAHRVRDPLIEGLLDELATILDQIAKATDEDDRTSTEKLRTYVNDSGVLLQLEIMSAASDRVAELPNI